METNVLCETGNLETSEMPFADLFAKETEEDIPALDNFLGHGLGQPVRH